MDEKTFLNFLWHQIYARNSKARPALENVTIIFPSYQYKMEK